MIEEDLIYTYEELANLTIKYQDLYLKERNKVKKAIEYINEKSDYPVGYYHCLKELRDILKGEGK